MNAWKKLCRMLAIPVIVVLINPAVIVTVLVKLPPLAATPRGTVGDGTRKLVRQGAGTPRREDTRTPPQPRGEPDRDALAKERSSPDNDDETDGRRLAQAPARGDASVGAPSRIDRDPKRSSAAAPTGPRPRDRRAVARVEYDARKAQAGDAADAQQRLALWCDSHGLWDEARHHWEAVVRLDTRHEAARRRLGYRLRAGRWIADAALAESATQRKADDYWGKMLATDHRRIDTKRPSAARSQAEAVARVEAVRDPRAVPALWRVFAGHHSHHGLVVEVLSRIEAPHASRMLAALAVYSPDAKARDAATRTLAGRDPAEFRDKLVGLMNAPLRAQVREVPDPMGYRVRVLFIEDEKANYQFLYPAPTAPDAFFGGDTGCSSGISRATLARQFNREQAQMAQVLSDRQVESDLAAVAALNRSIDDLNTRVALVLSSTCGAHFGPDPDSWRRWLAQAQGTTYQPPDSRSKPTLAQVVAPLFSPTFLPVPAAT